MDTRLPVLFLGHGSPMTTITDVPERRAWQALGRVLPRPRAILVVSAHWETDGQTHVTGDHAPRTIHDFRGFPQELFDLQYPAPGSPELAARIVDLLGSVQATPDNSWGFDHGAWGVMQPMFPDADIPMVNMSLDRALTADAHLDLGKRLSPLRDEGVLIVGSGNIVHNLAYWRQLAGTQPDWALDFRARSNAAILGDDTHALTHISRDDQAAQLAINSAEHYLPLLYTMGAGLPGDRIGLFNDTLDGSLSMTSVLIGDTGLLQGIEQA